MTPQDSLAVGTFVQWQSTRPCGRRSVRVGWVVAENGCHIWQGARHRDGYGQVQFNGRLQPAHRARYEREVGPIPDGLILDHFACDNGPGGCCNPQHVRPVTPRENVLRSNSLSAVHASRTHCQRGHPFAGENLLMSRGVRVCRECHRVKERQRYARKKLARGVTP